MKIDIRKPKTDKVTEVTFAEQRKNKGDSFDFDNATDVELSNYGAKPNLTLNSTSILIEDWDYFKKAGDFLVEEFNKSRGK